MGIPDYIEPGKLKALALYIHIPFCVEKCDYCAFYSVAHSKAEWQEKWLQAVRLEFAKCRKLIGDIRISTIFIGGGTPSLLKLPLLEGLFKEIELFNLDGLEEYSIEANPESLSPDFLDLLKIYSIDRLSLGVQSLQPEELAMLGRRASLEHTLEALELLSAKWQGRLNLDFISGIPGQSQASLLDSLEKAIQMAKLDHISLYSLSAEEKTALQRRFQNEGLKHHPNHDSLWIKAYCFLQSQGFLNYEMANFAKPGKECRHNLAYWNLKPYWGFGPSAYSTLPGKKGVLRLSYASDLHLFNGRADKALAIESLTPKEFLTDTMIMGWRLKQGVSKGVFLRRFGSSLEDLLPGFYDFLVNKRILLQSKSHYRLSLKSRLFLDDVLLELMGALDELPSGLLRVNWPE